MFFGSRLGLHKMFYLVLSLEDRSGHHVQRKMVLRDLGNLSVAFVKPSPKM